MIEHDLNQDIGFHAEVPMPSVWKTLDFAEDIAAEAILCDWGVTKGATLFATEKVHTLMWASQKTSPLLSMLPPLPDITQGVGDWFDGEATQFGSSTDTAAIGSGLSFSAYDMGEIVGGAGANLGLAALTAGSSEMQAAVSVFDDATALRKFITRFEAIENGGAHGWKDYAGDPELWEEVVAVLGSLAGLYSNSIQHKLRDLVVAVAVGSAPVAAAGMQLLEDYKRKDSPNRDAAIKGDLRGVVSAIAAGFVTVLSAAVTSKGDVTKSGKESKSGAAKARTEAIAGGAAAGISPTADSNLPSTAMSGTLRPERLIGVHRMGAFGPFFLDFALGKEKSRLDFTANPATAVKEIKSLGVNAYQSTVGAAKKVEQKTVGFLSSVWGGAKSVAREVGSDVNGAAHFAAQVAKKSGSALVENREWIGETLEDGAQAFGTLGTLAAVAAAAALLTGIGAPFAPVLGSVGLMFGAAAAAAKGLYSTTVALGTIDGTATSQQADSAAGDASPELGKALVGVGVAKAAGSLELAQQYAGTDYVGPKAVQAVDKLNDFSKRITALRALNLKPIMQDPALAARLNVWHYALEGADKAQTIVDFLTTKWGEVAKVANEIWDGTEAGAKWVGGKLVSGYQSTKSAGMAALNFGKSVTDKVGGAAIGGAIAAKDFAKSIAGSAIGGAEAKGASIAQSIGGAAQAMGRGVSSALSSLGSWFGGSAAKKPSATTTGPSHQLILSSIGNSIGGSALSSLGNSIGGATLSSMGNSFGGGLSSLWGGLGFLQRSGDGENPDIDAGALREHLIRTGGAGSAPDTNVRQQLSGHLGFDPAGARLHTGPVAAAAARNLSAEAFTIGRDVFFGAGMHDTSSPKGLGLIAHELTHVGQQTGTIGDKARFFSKSGGDAMEREAQQTAERVLANAGNRGGLFVESYSRIYEASDPEGISAEDQIRLDRISLSALREAEHILGDSATFGPTDSIEIAISLDLEGMTDAEAACAWANAIVEEVRSSGAAAYISTPAVQRKVAAVNHPVGPQPPPNPGDHYQIDGQVYTLPVAIQKLLKLTQIQSQAVATYKGIHADYINGEKQNRFATFLTRGFGHQLPLSIWDAADKNLSLANQCLGKGDVAGGSSHLNGAILMIKSCVQQFRSYTGRAIAVADTEIVIAEFVRDASKAAFDTTATVAFGPGGGALAGTLYSSAIDIASDHSSWQQITTEVAEEAVTHLISYGVSKYVDGLAQGILKKNPLLKKYGLEWVRQALISIGEGRVIALASALVNAAWNSSKRPTTLAGWGDLVESQFTDWQSILIDGLMSSVQAKADSLKKASSKSSRGKVQRAAPPGSPSDKSSQEDAAKATGTLVEDSGGRSLPSSVVARMSKSEKMGESILRAGKPFGADVVDQLRGLTSKKSLAFMGITTTVWAASHAIAVGEVVDGAMLLLGAFMLKGEVMAVAGDLKSFVQISRDAKTEEELDEAAGHLSKAVAAVGVDAVVAILTHKATKSIKGKIAREPRGRASADGLAADDAAPSKDEISSKGLKPHEWERQITKERWQEASRTARKLGGRVKSFYVDDATGPLGRSAASLRGRTYFEVELRKNTTLYRLGSATEVKEGLGKWFGMTKPASVIQERIDMGVNTQWQNPTNGQTTGYSPMDTLFEVNVPAGSTVYFGEGSPMETAGMKGSLAGGKTQIFVPDTSGLQFKHHPMTGGAKVPYIRPKKK